MPTKIIIKSNGSIKAEGEFELFDDKGNKFDIGERTRISLCRCGLSKTKPFCDHSHRDGNFQAESIAFALPPPMPKQ
ncbi:MAG: CDGSH iron-sulfur domain-containing protein [Ignavibacteriales bacterium]|nr:CDGSH iron-sulfur domain-containing protein [Ignavibacteriales bacterium]